MFFLILPIWGGEYHTQAQLQATTNYLVSLRDLFLRELKILPLKILLLKLLTFLQHFVEDFKT